MRFVLLVLVLSVVVKDLHSVSLKWSTAAVKRRTPHPCSSSSSSSSSRVSSTHHHQSSPDLGACLGHLAHPGEALLGLRQGPVDEGSRQVAEGSARALAGDGDGPHPRRQQVGHQVLGQRGRPSSLTLWAGAGRGVVRPAARRPPAPAPSLREGGTT